MYRVGAGVHRRKYSGVVILSRIHVRYEKAALIVRDMIRDLYLQAYEDALALCGDQHALVRVLDFNLDQAAKRWNKRGKE